MMGRSVSTPRDCTAVCYQDASHLEDIFDWEYFVDAIKENAKSLFPSMRDCDEWIGREDHAILENNFAYIGVSEYCGLVAIWLKSKAEDYEGSYYVEDVRMASLASSWCNRIIPSFESAFSQYKRVGRFSNGEAIYEKIA